ncbi:MAG: hypothetical protein Q9169_006868 [Polycauliona sp. 2 TL-2023]
MRYQIIALAALSLEYVIAQPAHRHHHKARRTPVDYLKAVKHVNWDNVIYDNPAYNNHRKGTPVQNNQAANVVDVVPVPAESNQEGSDQNESEHSDDGQSSDNSSGSAGSISGVIGGAKGKFGGKSEGHLTEGGTEDQYHGNVGVPYGSNMMAINTGDVDKYKYTNTFKNIGSNPLTIQIWNKNGRDDDPQSGAFQDPNMKFTVQAGQSQAVAFDENTMAAFSRDCDRSKVSNGPECVWGEMSFGSEMPAVNNHKASKKASGFNRSSIPGGANEILTMTCMSCDAKSRAETKSGKGFNEWGSAGEAYKDNKNGIPKGVAHLLTEMAI